MAKVSRRDVYIAARGYVGTPFRQQGRIKGVGSDCIGIVLCVGEELGLTYQDGRPIKSTDYLNYALFPTRGQMHDEVGRIFTPAPACGVQDARGRRPIDFAKLQYGNILMVGDPRNPLLAHHLAIVSEIGDREVRLGMIHAYTSIRRVAEHSLDLTWRARITGVFSYSGISD